MMKKTLVALAALTAAGAFAQSQVTLSGRASMDVSSFQTSGAAAAGDANNLASRGRVADSGSRITFQAQETVDGVTAGVYCETGMNIDNASSTGQANTTNNNTTTWCSREGRAYIGTSFAEIRLGRQNLYWTQGEINQTGSNFTGTDVLTNFVTGGISPTGTRLENVIMLKANKDFGAFANSEIYYGYGNGYEAAAGGVSPGNVTAVSTSVATNLPMAQQNQHPGTYQGLKLQYSQGAHIAMLDIQNGTSVYNSLTSASSVFDKSASKFGYGYRFGNKDMNGVSSIVSFQYWTKSRTDKTTPAGTYASATGSASDNGYGLNALYNVDSRIGLYAQYAMSNNITGTSVGEQPDSGATGYTLGATYRFSKRTHVYTAYHQINNGRIATYTLAGGNYASNGSSSSAGSQVNAMALGFIHTF